MRGVIRPAPGQQRPRGRSGERSDGHAGGVVARIAVMAAGVGAAALTVVTPAAAQEVTGKQSATASGVAPAEPMLFGLGLAGLFWLSAGLLALVVGFVLATRRAHRPLIGAETLITTTTTISNERAGGTE